MSTVQSSSSAWSALSLFQSTDIIRRRFYERHGRRLNHERASEIAACFVQGNDYYRSAKGAADIVKPLLLYYGTLSLSHGIILFLNSRKKEESLSPSHGLSQFEWRASWKPGNKGILSLAVRANGGTFMELAQATRNELCNRVGFYNQILFQSKQMPLAVTENDKISLSDILSRTEELRKLYEECSQDTARVESCIAGSSGTQQHITIEHSKAMLAEHREEFRARFKIPTSIGIRFNVIPSPAMGFPVAFNDPIYTAHLENRGPKGHCLLEPWPNDGYLSPLLRYFAMSFILGTLVRYFPSKWMATLYGHQSGDAVLPLIRATVDLLESGFPIDAINVLR